MSPVIVVILCFLVYVAGYFIYSRYLADRVYELKNTDGTTPAHMINDGVDYVPTKKMVLFGHHYASVAGLAPVLGPAVAVIWGWLPAMVWVVLGAILVGAVHDFSALVISARHGGQSIGKIAEGLLGNRARSLFHAIIFFLVSLAMGVFVLVIAGLFSAPIKTGTLKKVSSDRITVQEVKKNHHSSTLDSGHKIGLRKNFPEAVIPSAAIMVLAIITGYLYYKRQYSITALSLASFAITLAITYFSMSDQVIAFTGLDDPATSPSPDSWKLILLGYAFLASVTPVWLLLQSRDYINSFLLYLGIVLIYAGFFIGGIGGSFSSFNAEAVRSESIGLDLLPFVFITIACGAVSGFHSLVSSGTTAKQLNKETDARFIGYGGMIGESLLGLTAVIACTIGFSSAEEWSVYYRSWAGIQGLAPQVGAYIYGTGRFLNHVGIPENLGQGFVALVVVSFALTSLDSATRLLRYNIEEIADSTGIELIKKTAGNRYISSLIAVAAIGMFAFLKVEQDGVLKPAGLSLWKLFGTTNQLLAGLALLVATIYLLKQKKPAAVAFLPMIFILTVTLWAMVSNFQEFLSEKSPSLLLAFTGGLLIFLALWLLVEGVIAWLKIRRGE